MAAPWKGRGLGWGDEVEAAPQSPARGAQVGDALGTAATSLPAVQGAGTRSVPSTLLGPGLRPEDARSPLGPPPSQGPAAGTQTVPVLGRPPRNQGHYRTRLSGGAAELYAGRAGRVGVGSGTSLSRPRPPALPGHQEPGDGVDRLSPVQAQVL